MRAKLLAGLVLAALTTASMAHAGSVSDPAGDFLPTYTGPKSPDLDVTSLAVSYDSSSSEFLVNATFAGDIDPNTSGVYVYGVDTGRGAIAPFGSIGEGKVVFDQTFQIDKNGTGTLGGKALDPNLISITGNDISVVVPLSLLPSTGFAPDQYGFNLWPRSVPGFATNTISDFAPNDALLTSAPSAAPEPGTWMLMVVAMAIVGLTLRQTKSAFLPEAA